MQAKYKSDVLDLECPNNETRDLWHNQVTGQVGKFTAIPQVRRMLVNARLKSKHRSHEKCLEDIFQESDKK